MKAWSHSLVGYLVLATLAFGCTVSQGASGGTETSTNSTGTGGDTCQTQTCPDPAAGTYQHCSGPVTANGCTSYVKTCDGTMYACAGCADCNEATDKAVTWCNSTSKGCGTAAPQCGGDLTSDKACNTCLNDSCCSELEKCFGGECKTIVTCTETCSPTDFACLQGCVNQHPNGAADYKAANDCYQQNCKGSCP